MKIKCNIEFLSKNPIMVAINMFVLLTLLLLPFFFFPSLVTATLGMLHFLLLPRSSNM